MDNQKNICNSIKKHIENIVKVQNKKINESIRDKPTISNDSKRIANNLRNKNEKNIYLKLFNDFSLREKNKDEMRRKSFQKIAANIGFLSNKKFLKKK